MFESNKTNNISKLNIIGNAALGFGVPLTFLGFGITMLEIGIYETPDDIGCITAYSILTLGGLSVAVLGLFAKKYIKTFRIYASILSGDPNKSLINISNSVKKPYLKVKQNIARMIKWGLMTNCFIDEKTQTIFFLKTGEIDYDYENTCKLEYRIVQCKGCGALNKVIYGTTKKCDYCGSIIGFNDNKPIK